MSGKNLIKWDRMRETNADEEDEECEQNEEEYTDEAEKLQQELIDGQEDDDNGRRSTAPDWVHQMARL